MKVLRNLLGFLVIAAFASLNVAYAQPVSECLEVENVSSEVPNVIGISGFTEMNKDLAEPFNAELDGPLPAGAYVEWIITADGETGAGGGEFNNGDNTGMGVLVVFRQAGDYYLTARVRSASGKVGQSRYIRIKVY